MEGRKHNNAIGHDLRGYGPLEQITLPNDWRRADDGEIPERDVPVEGLQVGGVFRRLHLLLLFPAVCRRKAWVFPSG